MTKTTIDRKYAEDCKRAARSASAETERRHYVAVWNEFCQQEQARLDVRRAPVGSEPYAALWGG